MLSMNLTLSQAVRATLVAAARPLSPGQIKDAIKQSYPYLFGTQAQRDGIARGSYQSEDHALLNPIYSIVTKGSEFVVDRSQRPMMISLAIDESADEAPQEDYEAETGLVYVLSTDLFTRAGKHIVKIGHTTQALEARIAQLYTTGTPYQFKELKSWRVKNYTELEQALHRLLSPFRINRAREFFSEEAVAFVERVVEVHNAVQNLA